MKKCRKMLVGMIVALTMMMAVTVCAQAAWDGTAASNFYSGTGTQANPYVVKTEKQLAYFANQLVAGNTFEGKYIKLQANLNMTGSDWSTGTADFAGTFLGNGYTITINDQFLYRIAAAGVVDWLNLKNTETMSAPLLCEYNLGTIQNCRTEGDIYADATSAASLLCYDNRGTVVNSSGFGSIEGHGDDCSVWVGWISKSTGTIKNCYTVLTLAGSAPGKYNSLHTGEIVANGVYENCYMGTDVVANDADFVALLNQSLTVPGYIWALDKNNVNDGYPIIKTCLTATTELAASSDLMFTYHSSTLTTSISCDVSGCTIYYTLDGSDPTTSSTRKVYNGSLKLSGDTVVTTVAYKNSQYSIPKRQYAIQLIGSGTENDPYQVSTKLNLYAIRLEPDRVYELTTDLDFTDGGYVHNGMEVTEWKPIPTFSGTLEGEGHSITGLLSTKGGLVSSNNGTIRELRLLDHQLRRLKDNRGYTGDFGPIAHTNSGLITCCYAKAAARYSSAISSWYGVGGIVGYNTSSGVISYCYSSGPVSVSAIDRYEIFAVGGIAGYNYGTIRSCYSDASIYGAYSNHDWGSFTGGIAAGGYAYDCRFDGYVQNGGYDGWVGIIAYDSPGSPSSRAYRLYDGGAVFDHSGKTHYNRGTNEYKTTGTGKDRLELAFPAFDFDTVWMITEDGPMPQGIMQADGKIYTKYSYTAPGMDTYGQTVCYVNGGYPTKTFTLSPAGMVMGTHGDNLIWSRTAEGALTITGTGEMAGDDIWDFPWYCDPTTDQVIADQITSIEIGSGVTTIAPYAFYKSGATTVSLPNTLTSIGDYAFDRSGISSLTLPASLTEVGYGAFYGKTITLTFTGDAPTFSISAFHGATVTAYYPANNTTWTSDVRQNYGGNVTWVCNGTCTHNYSYRTTVGKIDATCTTEGYTGDTVCRLCDGTVSTGSVTEPLGHDEVRQVGLAAACTEDGYIAITCSRCDYSEQEAIPALGHRVRGMGESFIDPLTIVNGSAVPFKQDGNTYTSANKSSSSSSDIRITALYDCVLTLNYGVSSESNYDKLTILLNSTQKDAISGVVSNKTMTLTLSTGDVVTVRYSKDSSVDKNLDQGWVTLSYEQVAIEAEVDIPADSVEADCRGDVVCAYCQTVVKQRLPHTEVTDAAVAPTCVDTGLTEGSHCGVCGATVTAQEIVSATGRHQYDLDEGYDATCTETGLSTGSSCHVCGFVHLAQNVLPMLDHTAVIDEAVAATCTKTGLTEGSHCGVCGEELVAQTEVPVIDHTEVIDPAVEPTCTETGLTEGSHCGVCGKVLAAQTEVPVIDHTEVIDPAVESTCTETGLTEGSHCGVCGKVLVAQEKTVEKNHTVVIDEPKAATCTESGWKGTGMHCDVCQTVLLAQEEILSLGHKWSDATCTDPKTCSACGATEGEANGHTWNDATCTDPKTCSVCNATEGEANGHTWNDATCTNPKTCSVCGTTEGEAAGHKWNDATCTAPKTCSVCGTTEGTAAGHTKVSHEGKQPTCVQIGWNSYETCANCDYTTYEELEATGTHTLDAYGKCTICQTAETPVGYDRATGTLVLHDLPEHTEMALIAIYNESGQLIGMVTGTVGVPIHLPLAEGSYKICVFYLDNNWNPVSDRYLLVL